MEKVLIIGLALRVIVYLFLSPFNNDPHYEIIQHIFYMKEIPLAHQYDQAYHPPLYYIIASLFLNFGNEKAVQFFSFILSSLTLFIIYLTINKLDFIQPISIKIICLLVAAFLPPFVVFGLYISNDTLSYLIGASLFLQIYNYINKPTIINGMFLAVLLGVGLLTKATLIAFIPALIFVLIITNIRKKVPHNKTVLLLCIFLAVSLSIGSYKYIQNTVSLGTPIIHNLDFNPIWAEQQKPTLQGISSFVDFNILKLVETPTVSSSTLHSLPLLFYGTFWYEYIPESSFRGNLTNLSKVGSLIYVIALIPTMLIFLGLMRILSSLPSLQDCTSLEGSVYKKNIFEWSAL
ncbi:MAG: glycosyltransferase family 39 protein, partial [Smithella sp.]|nr:glycosyltransferase family 39 protein [Smithella sp.]